MNFQEEFLLKALGAAKDAQHVFPDYTAAEAALESAWGRSALATQANNLFGRKASHVVPEGTETIQMPTKEYLHGEWVTVPALWIKFSSWEDCFHDRMAVLHRLPSLYSEALSAPDGKTFIELVSTHWSTDPDRAAKVLEIYVAHQGVLNGT